MRSRSIPEAPGVYCFYGLNPLPLYIGKSINLRERVAAHFSSDYRSANDLRLSAEITRIEIEETAGELGALLRESQLIKTLLPAYNQRLRRRSGHGRDRTGAGTVGAGVRAFRSDRSGSAGRPVRAVFVARQGTRDAARNVAASAGCAGASWDSNAASARASRGRCSVATARASVPKRARRTPRVCAKRCRRTRCSAGRYPGMVAVRETDIMGERTDVHVFRRLVLAGHGAATIASLGALGRSSAARRIRP